MSARTLNVGTMTGQRRELVDMIKRRKVDLLCVCKKTGGRGASPGVLQVGANCSPMVWMGG